MSKIIYLSIPYTFNPEKSFKIANKITANLMQDGYVVFSPVSHGHNISKLLKEEHVLSWEFWKKQDLPMLGACDEMWLVHIEGKHDGGEQLIFDSRGCIEEINFCYDNNININHYRYAE